MVLEVEWATCYLSPVGKYFVSVGEADLVLHYLKKLSFAGVPLNSVAVIAPYNLQVGL